MAQKTLQDVYDESGQAYEDAVVIPRSMPEDGPYTTELTDVVERVVKNRDQVEVLMVTLVGEIVDGDLAGRRYRIGTYTPNNIGMLKEVAEVVVGETLSLAQDIAALKAKIGTLLACRVVRTTDQRGREWANAYVDSVISDAGDEAATPTTQDDG